MGFTRVKFHLYKWSYNGPLIIPGVFIGSRQTPAHLTGRRRILHVIQRRGSLQRFGCLEKLWVFWPFERPEKRGPLVVWVL